jgi:hypothetical protein
MARPKDSVIEESLRRVVRDAVTKDEDLSVKQARVRVEKELGLEDGFFLNTIEWKQKSKSVLVAAIAEEPKGDEPAPAPKPKSNASKTQSLGTTSQNIAKPATGGTKVTKSKVVTGKGAKAKISDERVVDDDSSDGESRRSQAHVSKTSAPKKPAQPKQVNGIKRKAEEESTSDEDSESESRSGSEEKVDTDARQKKKARKAPSSSSGEDSEDSSERESEEDDDKSQDRSDSSENVAATTTQAVPAIPPKTFKPPSGFTLVESDRLTARLPLSPSNLNGKQIWQITAPSSLSVSSIKEISLESLRSSQPVLTQNGIQYVLSEKLDSDGDACTVLLPSENAYQRLDHRIERTLHLQQKIALPNLSIRQADLNTGSSAAAEVRASHITSSRQQPKGLRMRYKPPGSGPGSPGIVGSESDSNEDEQTALHVSATTGLTQDIVKMDVDDDVAEQTSKKSKKKRKSKDSGESTKPTINEVRNGDSNSPKVSKPSRSSMIDGPSEEFLAMEERKRLKRERKEAKQKAKLPIG